MIVFLFLLFGLNAAACTIVEGQWISGADFAASSASLAALPVHAIFGRSPDPGQVRAFSEAQVQSIARRYLTPLESVTSICFERRTRKLTREELDAEIRHSLESTAYHFELLDFSPLELPQGRLVLPVVALFSGPRDASGGVLWRGRYEYDGTRSLALWVKVRVWEERERLEATRDLPVGKPILADGVRIVQVQAMPRTPGTAAIRDAVGMAPRRTIRAGEPVLANILSPPLEVQRGDVVSVLVQGGAASLQLQAVAQSSGHSGQFIVVRNIENGRMFRAQVQGVRKVEVEYVSSIRKE